MGGVAMPSMMSMTPPAASAMMAATINGVRALYPFIEERARVSRDLAYDALNPELERPEHSSGNRAAHDRCLTSTEW
jgi:hypothetical protein